MRRLVVIVMRSCDACHDLDAQCAATFACERRGQDFADEGEERAGIFVSLALQIRFATSAGERAKDHALEVAGELVGDAWLATSAWYSATFPSHRFTMIVFR